MMLVEPFTAFEWFSLIVIAKPKQRSQGIISIQRFRICWSILSWDSDSSGKDVEDCCSQRNWRIGLNYNWLQVVLNGPVAIDVCSSYLTIDAYSSTGSAGRRYIGLLEGYCFAEPIFFQFSIWVMDRSPVVTDIGQKLPTCLSGWWSILLLSRHNSYYILNCCVGNAYSSKLDIFDKE